MFNYSWFKRNITVYKIESKNLPIDERVSVKKKTKENQDVTVQENNKKTTKKKAKKKKNKK